MKTFIAYRHSGEDPKRLEPLLGDLKKALEDKGIDTYCTFFDEDMFETKNLSKRQIIDHAFAEIDKIDFLFVLLASDQKSEGMLMEIGYCLAKKIPIIVAVKSDIKGSHAPAVADRHFEWADTQDLVKTVRNFDFQPGR